MLYFDIESKPPSKKDIDCENCYLEQKKEKTDFMFCLYIKLCFGLSVIGLLLLVLGSIFSIFELNIEFKKSKPYVKAQDLEFSQYDYQLDLDTIYLFANKSHDGYLITKKKQMGRMKEVFAQHQQEQDEFDKYCL